MSLRKPYTLTPARLAANRRNALKSTGPRTPRGKAQLRLNALRGGGYSRLCFNVLEAVLSAPPGAMDKMARAVLTPQQAAHPAFADLVELACLAAGGKPLISRQAQRQHEKLMDAVRAMHPLPRWLSLPRPTRIRREEARKTKVFNQSH